MAGKKAKKGKKESLIYSLFKRKKRSNLDIEKNSENISVNNIQLEKQLYSDLPKNLQIGKESSMYKAWNLWVKEDKPIYDPLEYMYEEFLKVGTSDLNDRLLKKINNEFIQLVANVISYSEIVYSYVLQDEMIKKAKDEDNLLKEKLDNNQIDEKYQSLKAFGGIDINKNNNDGNLENIKELVPADADIFIHISESKTNAWIVVYPPRNGGKDITTEMIQKKLDEEKIIFGIDEKAISEIVEKQLYFKLIRIAKGIEPKDGKDGEIIDIISRNNEVNIKENEEGKINYKELNLIQSIHKGDPICKIVKPGEAENGKNIFGEEVKAYVGKMPTIPKGANTQISEDGTILEASIDGHVYFDKGVFTIQNLLTIQGDVDNSVGNVNFAGDILIKGKVREGFSVISDANITIKGNVEPNSIIKAEGNVIIERGVNGGAKGIVEAKGKIKAKYIENCRVLCGDKIETEVIIDSIVECEDSLSVVRGKGTIIGGRITVGKQIDVRVIGNENNSGRQTEILLGFTPNLIKERNNVKKQLEEVTANLEKLTTNINYLERFEEQMDHHRKMLLGQLRIQVPIRYREKSNLEKKLEELNEFLENVGYCKIKAGVIYPITTINLCNEVQIIHEVQKNFTASNSSDKAKS